MDTSTLTPALEAGLAALREAGISGAPEREAKAIADFLLDEAWNACGLDDTDLDDAHSKWWAVDAPDALMASFRDGLREHARRAVRERAADLRTSEFDEGWSGWFVEAVAAEVELPAEDVVSIASEFCPVRNHEHALFLADLEVRTYHSPSLVHCRFLKRHKARNSGYPPPWYRDLLKESRAFFADEKRAA